VVQGEEPNVLTGDWPVGAIPSRRAGPVPQVRDNDEEGIVRYFRLSFVVASAILAGASGSHALNLSGTWQGTESCANFSGSPNRYKLSVTLTISDAGASLNANLAGGSFLGGFQGTSTERFFHTDAGEAGLILCGSSPASDAAVVRLRAKTSGDEGSLRGTATGVDTVFGTYFTCKYKLKRTSPIDPVVGGCS